MRAEGRVDELLAAHGANRVEVEVGALDPAALAAALAAIPGAMLRGPGSAGRTLVALEGLEVHELLGRLVGAGVAVNAVVPRERNLEEVFLEVTG